MLETSQFISNSPIISTARTKPKARDFVKLHAPIGAQQQIEEYSDYYALNGIC
jgi:hypothetical protein